MLKRLVCALAAAALLLMMTVSCLAQTVTVDYDEAGIRLKVDEALFSQYGLDAYVENYGTVLCLPITCMNPEYRENAFEQWLEAVEADDEEQCDALAEDYYAHQNLLNVIFIMSSEQYAKTKQFGRMPFDETRLTALGEHNGYMYWLSSHDVLDEEEAVIVKRKTFPAKPMDIEEAEMQMELLGHSFFVFLNSETEEVNVLYKRRDGNLGLIEPEYD